MRGRTHSTRDPDMVARLQLPDDIPELFGGFVRSAVKPPTSILDSKDEVSTRHDAW